MSFMTVTIILHQFINVSLQGGADNTWHYGTYCDTNLPPNSHRYAVGMELGLNPEPNSLQPASSEDQELGCPQPIKSEAVSKVDVNPPGSESLPTPQSFASTLPVPDNGIFTEVMTCNTGSWGGKISNPTNKKSIKPAPVLSNTFRVNPPYTIATNNNPSALDSRSFPEIPTHSAGGLLGKISKSTNENCPKPAQSLENDAGTE
ncbi:hypothetical protein DSO57_1017346 [Entomophthora muscae]|uniref:Uncharacterized protein n=1 Tax=Entomophthora muscae TaxID=34485 RepID=A0ACC2SHN9_9FUNG|nr:hypothetical protein DSO57_1017346 [Entomophthora muscae]